MGVPQFGWTTVSAALWTGTGGRHRSRGPFKSALMLSVYNGGHTGRPWCSFVRKNSCPTKYVDQNWTESSKSDITECLAKHSCSELRVTFEHLDSDDTQARLPRQVNRCCLGNLPEGAFSYDFDDVQTSSRDLPSPSRRTERCVFRAGWSPGCCSRLLSLSVPRFFSQIGVISRCVWNFLQCDFRLKD